MQLIDGGVPVSLVLLVFRLLARRLLAEVLAPPVTVADTSVLGFCPFLPQVLALWLGAYTLEIVMSSWRIDPLSLCDAPLYPG